MVVIDKRRIENKNCKKITFFRINPEDKRETIKKILYKLTDISWIDKFLKKEDKLSMLARVNPTIKMLNKKLNDNDNDDLTSDVGEYFVSEIARETIIRELSYTDIPLAELRKEQVSGNPGFDYHSESDNNIIIFGEAKYKSGQNAYGSALRQVVNFIEQNKDKKEIIELKSFVSDVAVENANNGKKGYAIGFSSYTINTEQLLKNILNNSNLTKLLSYEEIIIIAVDING